MALNLKKGQKIDLTSGFQGGLEALCAHYGIDV